MENNQTLAISYNACRLNTEQKSNEEALLLARVNNRFEVIRRLKLLHGFMYCLQSKIVFGRDTNLHVKDLLKTTTPKEKTANSSYCTACSVDASVQV